VLPVHFLYVLTNNSKNRMSKRPELESDPKMVTTFQDMVTGYKPAVFTTFSGDFFHRGIICDSCARAYLPCALTQMERAGVPRVDLCMECVQRISEALAERAEKHQQTTNSNMDGSRPYNKDWFEPEHAKVNGKIYMYGSEEEAAAVRRAGRSYFERMADSDGSGIRFRAAHGGRQAVKRRLAVLSALQTI